MDKAGYVGCVTCAFVWRVFYSVVLSRAFGDASTLTIDMKARHFLFLSDARGIFPWPVLELMSVSLSHNEWR